VTACSKIVNQRGRDKTKWWEWDPYPSLKREESGLVNVTGPYMKVWADLHPFVTGPKSVGVGLVVGVQNDRGIVP